MNEFLHEFRAWDCRYRRMIYAGDKDIHLIFYPDGFNVSERGEHNIFHDRYEEEFDFLFWTGQYDWKLQKLYDRDIIKDSGSGKVGWIMWDRRLAGWKMFKIGEPPIDIPFVTEKLGNIYENPQFLMNF